ncbi:MAG: DUF2461 domain-containing protein [Bacteroidales bacterium]
MNIIPFLRLLSANNNREWFEANRKQYDIAKSELLDIVVGLISEIKKFDPDLGDPDPSKCLFRIYRDVRFSHDKSPYKTYMSAFISKGGKGFSGSGYYIHFEPDKSFAGGGIYGPQPNIQQAIRNEIYFNAPEFESIILKPSFVNTYGSIMQEKYSRLPKGYPPDFAYGDLLKFKHYVASCEIPENVLQTDEIQSFTTKVFIELQAFNQFLNRALQNV